MKKVISSLFALLFVACGGGGDSGSGDNSNFIGGGSAVVLIGDNFESFGTVSSCEIFDLRDVNGAEDDFNELNGQYYTFTTALCTSKTELDNYEDTLVAKGFTSAIWGSDLEGAYYSADVNYEFFASVSRYTTPTPTYPSGRYLAIWGAGPVRSGLTMIPLAQAIEPIEPTEVISENEQAREIEFGGELFE